ncbi:MAG: ATP-binding protein [Acholeplasmatales bacterium]|nr:ATP-binding protein [Acholeplasmatales bacterium]
MYINKEPIIFDISSDKYINITGETGSGKSTYTKEHFSSDDYVVVETDVLFNEKYKDNEFLNKLRNKIFKKYSDEHYPGGYNLKINFNHFNDVLKIIIDNKQDDGKTLVIDSGQFRHLKRYDLLKGKLIVMRTSVKESIKRACERFEKRYPNATEAEKESHRIKKYTAYELYKKFNTVIIKSFILYRF